MGSLRGVRSSLIRRFQTGIGWNLIAVCSTQGTTFLLNIIISNIVGLTSFGEYAILLSTIQSASALGSLGMGYTASKYLAEYRSVNRDRAGELLGFCLALATYAAVVTALLLLAFAPLLCTSLWKSQQLTPLVRICAATVFFNSLSLTLSGILAGLEAFSLVGRSGIVVAVFSILTCSVCSKLFGTQGAVFGLLLGSLFQFVVLARCVKAAAHSNGIVPRFNGVLRESSILFKWVIPGVLSGLTALPALWLAQTFVLRQPGGSSALGLYASAFNLMSLVLVLPNVVNSVSMSMLNNLLGEGETAQYKQAFWMNTTLSLGISIVAALTIGLSGPLLLRVYGKEYIAGLPILSLLLIATLPECLGISLNQVLQSRGKAWLAVLSVNLPRDSAIVCLSYFLVPAHGAIGLAIAYLGGRVLATLAILIDVLKLGLNIPHVESTKPTSAEL